LFLPPLFLPFICSTLLITMKTRGVGTTFVSTSPFEVRKKGDFLVSPSFPRSYSSSPFFLLFYPGNPPSKILFFFRREARGVGDSVNAFPVFFFFFLLLYRFKLSPFLLSSPFSPLSVRLDRLSFFLHFPPSVLDKKVFSSLFRFQLFS